MATEKFKGNVKWFSNRKGFGFITPSSDNAPTKEDIFVHQTAIVVAGSYRTLTAGYEVEFEVKPDEGGKLRCQNVTAVGGGPCEVPEREKRRKKEKKDGEEEGDGGNSGDEGAATSGDEGATNGKKKRTRDRKKKKPEGAKDGEKAPAGGRKGKKRFDEGFTEDVKNAMKAKKLDMRQATILISIDSARLKFGPEGYAALCHADGILAEGSFTCDEAGNVAITWRNVLKYDDGWKTSDPLSSTSTGALVSSFNWRDDKVEGMKGVETPESLWGEGKSDPAEALESNNFQMRKCFLVKNPVKRPKGRRNRGGKKTNGEAKSGDEKSGDESDGGKADS